MTFAKSSGTTAMCLCYHSPILSLFLLFFRSAARLHKEYFITARSHLNPTYQPAERGGTGMVPVSPARRHAERARWQTHHRRHRQRRHQYQQKQKPGSGGALSSPIPSYDARRRIEGRSAQAKLRPSTWAARPDGLRPSELNLNDADRPTDGARCLAGG